MEVAGTGDYCAVAELWSGKPCERLTALVKASGLTQDEIGLRLNVKGPSVSRWCSGERTPNADVLAALLEIVGGSADEVLGLSGHVGAENARLLAALRQVAGAATTVLGVRAARGDKRGRGR